MNRHLKRAILVAIIIVAVFMILDITYYFNGSFELYPTEEQEEKVRLVTGVMFFMLFIIEVILVFIYRKVNR